MIIAIPKEIYPGENRVACVPDVAAKYIKQGFEVQVESDAGLKAGFTNENYEKHNTLRRPCGDLIGSCIMRQDGIALRS